MSNIYLTSDPHYWHRRVILYCNRPFASDEERKSEKVSEESVRDMNVTLMNYYNQTVSNDDTVYILGDFAFCGVKKAEEILRELKGHKVLIQGNHDWHIKPHRWLDIGFEKVLNTLTIEQGGYRFRMSHFPYKSHNVDKRSYDEQLIDDGDPNTYLLHGHVHNAWKVSDNKRMINVGVDVHGYRPVKLDDIVKLVEGGSHAVQQESPRLA
jgi:calcineurin-like phosphoesterase family protein